MATGNIKGGKRNYARPTTPGVTATTSETSISATVTPSSLGPVATSYTYTATPVSTGLSTSVTTSATSLTITDGLTGNASYTFNVQAANYNGASGTTISNSVVFPSLYQLLVTANSTQNYTIPSGYTKMAVVAVGAGGTGNNGENGAYSNSNFFGGGAGGNGGGSGGIAGAWEIAVTPGQTASLTVGTAGNLSKVTYGGVDVVTANAGTANAGGNAQSNISTNILLTNGSAGGSGGSRALGTANAGNVPGNPGSAGTTTTYNTTLGGLIAGGVALTFTVGAGGGGGGGAYGQNQGLTAGGTGGTSVSNGGGGAGGNCSNNGAMNGGSTGTVATGFGGGGGGGGGAPAWAGGNVNNSPGSGAAGAAGRVYVYLK